MKQHYREKIPVSDSKKVKDTMPKKISHENWRAKKKEAVHGPGFFQKKFSPKASKTLEEWEKLSIIPWGGDFLDSTDFVKLINMCTLRTLRNFLRNIPSFNILFTLRNIPSFNILFTLRNIPSFNILFTLRKPSFNV